VSDDVTYRSGLLKRWRGRVYTYFSSRGGFWKTGIAQKLVVPVIRRVFRIKRGEEGPFT
jgi:hypothetical protein